jgi:hypothetical protein
MSNDTTPGFLWRWSRRKSAAREEPQGASPVEDPLPHAATDAPLPAVPIEDMPPALEPTQTARLQPPPTLDDVARLTADSEYTRFIAPDVPGDVRNAALRKLFSDPHFNVMDGLDTYIDDYHTPDPLPATLLKKMAQASFLGLASETAAPPQPPQSTQPLRPPSDEDADMRLQPDDAAGCAGLEPDAEPHAGREP